MKNIIYIYIFIFTHSVIAQQNNTWCFGDSAGIDFNNLSTPISIPSSVNSRGSCVSICDTSGVLQFYGFTRAGLFGNTARVYNANNNIMLNGDSIVGQGWYHELTIIPISDLTDSYYLFSVGETNSGSIGLYYSVIDMTQNNGNGAVVQKNIALNSFSNADCLTAIKHGNGRDWWVISKYSDMGATSTNEFYLYLITPDGVSFSGVQQLNNSKNYGLHYLVFNSDGTNLMQSHRAGFLCEYDFDRCTGIISNPNLIYPEQTSNFSRNIVDVAYSPDDSKLYISTSYYTNIDTSYLVQYNLNASNISASADTLGALAWPVQGGAVRLAPDGKIYYTCFYDWGFPGFPYLDTVHNIYNENLGVINYPDSLGSACNYQPFSFYLSGKRTYYGLPNNPNYSLGPLVGSPCDTLSTSITEIQSNPKLHLFHHSGWQKLFVNAEKLNGKNCTLEIFDISGKQIYRYSSNTAPPYFTSEVSTNSWGAGVYLVSLSTEKEWVSGKFVKE